jgi:uncharacterized protein
MKSFFAAALAAMTVGAPIMADAQTPPPPMLAGTRLDITARGEVTRVPDIAVITSGVLTNAADAANAMQQNATAMARVLAALKKAGVADKDVSTSSINLAPQYRYVENQAPVITGYQASNQVTIDKPESAQDEARVNAVKMARTRAELYANATGMRVKRIVSISESEGYSNAPMPMMVTARMESADAKTSVMPGEQSIGVTVSVVFELQ